MTLPHAWLLGGLLLLPLILYLRPGRRKQPDPTSLPSLVIPSYTSHSRLLPSESKHSFSYPLLYIGVDVDSLSAGELNIGRLFRYGVRPWTTVLGLRGDGYLSAGKESLRCKVEKFLADGDQIGRVWLVTMPSLLGWEGHNPLSVWYIYDLAGKLDRVVLEVHNTFEES